MSKSELRAYFDWYMAVMPERVEHLEETFHETAGFEDAVLDASPESLPALGDWFTSSVEARPLTTDEIERANAGSKYQFPVGSIELTIRTFSMAMDLGMYFAKVMMVKRPQLKWHQPLTAKKFVDYGQPVLIGAGPVPMNPVRLMITLAYGIARKRYGGSARIVEIFDYWSDQAAEYQA